MLVFQPLLLAHSTLNAYVIITWEPKVPTPQEFISNKSVAWSCFQMQLSLAGVLKVTKHDPLMIKKMKDHTQGIQGEAPY